MTTLRRLPLFALPLMLGACAGGGLGGLGDILTGGGQGGSQAPATMTAEVQEVRQQQQQIIVRTQDGQQGAVLFDQNTQVVYENQQYDVTALEYGDVVEMRIQQVQQGYYTDLIQVVQSVQERRGETTGGTTGGTPSDVHQVEGTINQIDLSRWMFTLDMTQGGSLPVYLPSTATTAQRERLRDYRSGDYVRVEVRALNETTAELVRWDWR